MQRIGSSAVSKDRHSKVVVKAVMTACVATSMALANAGANNGVPYTPLSDISSRIELQQAVGPQYWQNGLGSVGQAYSEKPQSLAIMSSVSSYSFAFSSSAISIVKDIAPKRCEDRRLIQWPAPGYWDELVQIKDAARQGEWQQAFSLSLVQLNQLGERSTQTISRISLAVNAEIQSLLDYRRRLMSLFGR
ncbi:hypothetical protein [uncultured Pseudoteredinibacter sp.]|uniref:hypothetical protein n=1 Tax=uncultured Pseudoteredinibacter sp. TaxID=1641701 RepID=UPI0026064030|nr:hypothetical protein [uncultured Pseudoteredinibacter sp.]